MAVAYFELGAGIDVFNDPILGLYLVGGKPDKLANDALIPKSPRTKAAIAAGHIVAITEGEYETALLAYENDRFNNLPNIVDPETTTISNASGVFPNNATELTGTLASSGTTVTGTGTAFETELQVGDYIYDDTTNTELRRVICIYSDTKLELAAAFTTDLTGETCDKIEPLYQAVEIMNSGSGNVTVDGVTLPAGGVLKLRAANQSPDRVLVKPFFYDCTGESLSIYYEE